MITAKFDPDHVPDQFRALFVKLSSKYALDVTGMDPFQEICGFQKPVLIVHGTRNRLVDELAKGKPTEKILRSS